MTRRLTDRHYDALAVMVRTLDPDGTGRIGDIDAVTAAAADLADHDLDHLGSPHLDAEPAGTHPALAYVRLIEPPHVVRWYEAHSSGWPPDDLAAAPATPGRGAAVGPERYSGASDLPSEPSRLPSAFLASAAPIQRRRLTEDH